MNYFKSQLLLTILICAQLGSPFSYAKTNTISIYSDEVVTDIILPEALCNISDSYEGHIISDFLTKQRENVSKENASYLPEALGIIGKCEGYEDLLYPWGYIVMLPNSKYTNTQEKYNKYITKYMASQQDVLGEFIEKLVQDIDKSGIVEGDHGMELDEFEMGKFKVIKTTDNAIHLLTIISFELNGIASKEVATMSQQIRGDQVLTIYLYDQLENITDALRRVNSIDETLKITNIIN